MEEQNEACIRNNIFLDLIHSDAAQFIQDRLQLYDDQHQTTSASHWNTIWTASQFFDAIDLIWPRGVENCVDFSIETRLIKTQPHITMPTALDDINSWISLVGRAVADEKKRLGADLPPDRQGQLIKILMDHLSPQDSPLAFLRHTVEKGGRPPTIDAFNRKLMLAGGEIQKAVHCVEVCGFSLVPKGSKRSSEQDFRRTSKKPKSSPVSDHSRHPPPVSKRGPPVCNGCGKPHKGDCLFKTHTALP